MRTSVTRQGPIGLTRAAAAYLMVIFLPLAVPAIGFAQTCGGSGNPPCSGTFLNGYYDTAERSSDNGTGTGDNILRLNNPTRGNGTLCAMIYVFDDDEEMGECCGCPLSPDKLLALSVKGDLTSNWAVFGPEGLDNDSGVIDIISATPDHTTGEPPCSSAQGCNGGCDPTNSPAAATIVPTPHLKGYILHTQRLAEAPLDGAGRGPVTTNLTEVPLADSGDATPGTLTYLAAQCGAIIGGSSGGGVCDCGVAGTE
jgi:hypothetical protein